MIRFAAPTLLLVLVALAFGVVARAEEEAPKTGVAAALEAFEQGRFKDAADAARAVPAEDADHARAAYLLGEASLVLGAADEAAKAFEAVLARRPDALPARIGLARAQVLAGRANEALETLERARKADPDDPDVLRVEGEARLALGETKAAITALEKAHKEDRDDAMVARALAQAYLVADEAGKAERVAKRLAKARRDHPMGPFLLGLVRERTGDDDGAVEAYQQALERDERFLDAHKNLAILCHTMSRTYQDRERVKLSMKHYARYFELGGHDPELEQVYRTTRGFLEANGALR